MYELIMNEVIKNDIL